MMYLVHVQSDGVDYVDDFNTWDDVLFEYPDLDHEFYPGFPVIFRDGDSEITISETNDEGADHGYFDDEVYNDFYDPDDDDWYDLDDDY